jgi:hypothetical protein
MPCRSRDKLGSLLANSIFLDKTVEADDFVSFAVGGVDTEGNTLLG